MINPRVQTRFKQPPGKPHFIKEWRKYRGLNQEQLADRIGKSTATISQIETRKQAYTQETLELLAHALMCTPADLLMRNPNDTEAPWSLWDQAKPADRQKIIGMMKIIVGNSTGTDG